MGKIVSLLNGIRRLILHSGRSVMVLLSLVIFIQFVVTVAKMCAAKNKQVLDLIYWRDPKKTGIVFGVSLAILISLRLFSIISVFAYVGLIVLTITLSFRLYKNVTGAIQKTEDGNPFKKYLDGDLKIPESKVHEQVDVLIKHGQDLAQQLRRLFLVENVTDSLKFGLLLWALTYVGRWFSGMTLVILAFIAVFTVPKFYETNKEQIDHYHGIAHEKGVKAWEQVQEKVPYLKKKQN